MTRLRSRGTSIPALAALTAAAGMLSCQTTPDRDPAIGEAWAGPPALTLRKDIDPKSPAAAVAHHGDRLEITARRRRWYKVRTAKGAEGWTDDNSLLDARQMQRLLNLAKQTAGRPSQGAATTFDTLRVHTEPNRQAVSFIQVREGEKFDVIAHRVTARKPLQKRELIPSAPKAEKKGKAKEKKSSFPPPPRPVPPGLPPDWVALSKQRTLAPEEELPPDARDDWTLIRTQSGQSGWVLTSRIYMSIPDEVAQYAEGHRITSYFSIGKVRDGDDRKDIWLWTTSETLGEDHDFDGYRVFTWSIRHHRYETAYIQRRERGFFPVLATQSQFSVCLERPDGSRIRKQFVLRDTTVRSVGEKACEAAEEDSAEVPAEPNLMVREAPAETGAFERLKARLKGLFGK